MNAKYQRTGLERQQRDLEVHGHDWHVDVLQILHKNKPDTCDRRQPFIRSPELQITATVDHIFYPALFFQLTGTYNSFESVNVLRHMKFTLISKNYERAMSITWRFVY